MSLPIAFLALPESNGASAHKVAGTSSLTPEDASSFAELLHHYAAPFRHELPNVRFTKALQALVANHPEALSALDATAHNSALTPLMDGLIDASMIEMGSEGDMLSDMSQSDEQEHSLPLFALQWLQETQAIHTARSATQTPQADTLHPASTNPADVAMSAMSDHSNTLNKNSFVTQQPAMAQGSALRSKPLALLTPELASIPSGTEQSSANTSLGNLGANVSGTDTSLHTNNFERIVPAVHSGTAIAHPVPSSSAPASTQQPASPAVYSPDFSNQLGRQFMHLAQSNNGQWQSAEIRLDPPELGPLRISLHIQDGVAHALISSAHAVVRHTLEQSLGQLQQQLAQSGLSLGQADVSDHSNAEQYQQSFHEFAQKTGYAQQGDTTQDTHAPLSALRHDTQDRSRNTHTLVDTYA